MAGHIPWQVVDFQLQAIRTVWIGTTRPDGRPHSVPVWFLWENADPPGIVFISPENTQKSRNLATQSWVIVHAGDGDDTYILEGAVTQILDSSERNALDHRYQEKYVDPNSGARASFGVTDLVYRVCIHHAMTWMYGNISNRTDWYFGKS
jgi:pyridoxine/pyridoxamine 5'-phosphate oxidase